MMSRFQTSGSEVLENMKIFKISLSIKAINYELSVVEVLVSGKTRQATWL